MIYLDFEIPEKWIACNIDEVAEVGLGKTPRKIDYSNDGNNKIIKFRDVSYKGVDWNRDDKGFVNNEAISDLKILHENDVLITASAHASEHIGKKLAHVVSIPKVFKNVFFVGELLCVRAYNNALSSKYIFYFFLSRIGYKAVQHHVKGVHLTSGEARKIKLPLPPINEQHRIVAKIEELFSELDKGIESLKTAREQLKVYRQSLLKHAFEGKLTEQWRQDNADKLEPADQLLARIQQEREDRCQQQLEEWKVAVQHWEAEGREGKSPNKPKMPKNLGVFSYDELGNFGQLPHGWAWLKFDKISDHNQFAIKAGPFGSALKKEFYVEDGFKVYGQEQVISGDAYYGSYYVDRKKYEELISCKVKPKDILISLVGTVGKVLILPDDCKEGILNPRLIKISLNREYYLPEFFKCFFESGYLKSLYKMQTHGATMDVLNLGIIQSLPFPLCTIDEQKEIIEELGIIFSVIDNHEKDIKDNLLRSEALRQSILKKAFSGQLVPQDPNDEPASELLKRIAAEKVELEAKAMATKSAAKKATISKKTSIKRKAS